MQDQTRYQLQLFCASSTKIIIFYCTLIADYCSILQKLLSIYILDNQAEMKPKITQEEVLSNQQPKITDAEAKWTDRQLSDVEKFKDQGNAKNQSKCKISTKYKILIGISVLIFIGMLIGLSVALSKIFQPQVKQMQKQNEVKFQDGSQLTISELIVELKNLRKKNDELKVIHSQIEASKNNQTSGEKTQKKDSDTITFEELGIIIKMNPDSTSKVLIHPQTFVGYMKEHSPQLNDIQNNSSSGQWQKQFISQLTMKFSKQIQHDTQNTAFVQYCINGNRFQQCPKEANKTRLLQEKSDKKDQIIDKKQIDKKAQQIFDYVMSVARKCRGAAKRIKQFVDDSKPTEKEGEVKDKINMKLKATQPKNQKTDPDTKSFKQSPTLAEQTQRNCIAQSSSKLLCHAPNNQNPQNNWIQISVKQI